MNQDKLVKKFDSLFEKNWLRVSGKPIKDYPFIATAVIYKGDNIYFNVSPGVGENHRFRLASVSKIFTAIAILQLYEKGQLDIHRPLDKHAGITAYELLSHDSGIVDGENPFSFTYDSQRAADIYYSNSGYMILAGIVEKITNQSYSEYLQENIFEALGIVDTGLLDPKVDYTKDGRYIPGDYLDYNEWAGASTAYSSIGDMDIFVRAMAAGHLLKDLGLLFRSQKKLCDKIRATQFMNNSDFRLSNIEDIIFFRGGLTGIYANILFYPTADGLLAIVILAGAEVYSEGGKLVEIIGDFLSLKIERFIVDSMEKEEHEKSIL